MVLPMKLESNSNLDEIPRFNIGNLDNSYFIGHRGLGKNTEKPFLENTINSFNQCAQFGLDFVELDVNLTKDNEAIVFHDFFLDHENSNGERDLLINLTYDQIKFQLGSNIQYGQFPTLNQVLKDVDSKIGILVEFKFPQLNDDGKMEHQSTPCSSTINIDFISKNHYVDRILQIILQNIIAKPRKIILLSFDADITLMLKLKQNLFPVFLCTRGQLLTDGSANHADSRINTFGGARSWAKFCNLNGLVSRYYESLHGDYLVSRKCDLKTFVYGDIPRTSTFLKESKLLGLDGLILDNVSDLYNQKLLIR